MKTDKLIHQLKYKYSYFPDWLVQELSNKSPEPDFNDLMVLLLEDYIERKEANMEKEKGNYPLTTSKELGYSSLKLVDRRTK